MEIRNDPPIVGSVRFRKISFILFCHLFMATVSNYVPECRNVLLRLTILAVPEPTYRLSLHKKSAVDRGAVFPHDTDRLAVPALV